MTRLLHVHVATVADAGFLEGGVLIYYQERSERDFLKPHPLWVKTTPIFNLSINPFLIETFAKAC